MFVTTLKEVLPKDNMSRNKYLKKIVGIVRGLIRRIQNTWEIETVGRELVQKKTGNCVIIWRTSACLFVVLRQFSIS